MKWSVKHIWVLCGERMGRGDGGWGGVNNLMLEMCFGKCSEQEMPSFCCRCVSDLV